MVDAGVWSRLDDAARREFHALFGQFREALRKHGVDDGYDLATDWSVQFVDGAWAISNGPQILDGVTSMRREIVEALYADGVQNLNR